LFAFPPELGQGLRGARATDLASVDASPSGLGLRWEKLDVDLLVPALLQGMFGTKAWMRELARAGGAARSEAKARASRLNGMKGGRPRKRGTVVAASPRARSEKADSKEATPTPGEDCCASS